MDHNSLIFKIAQKLEKNSQYSLVKYFIPASDRKTDLIGSFYPDITGMRREGRQKLMIEVQTQQSFSDPEELHRLRSLFHFCTSQHWEFYMAFADEATQQEVIPMLQGAGVSPKATWIADDMPLTTSSG